MVGCSRGGGGLPAWMTAAAARVDLSGGGGGGIMPGSGASSSQPGSSGPHQAGAAASAAADQELGMVERALSAAGAAFVSAIIVNPLDVAKTRLQAQAAGVPYYQPSQMASLGPDAVTNLMISLRAMWGL